MKLKGRDVCMCVCGGVCVGGEEGVIVEFLKQKHGHNLSINDDESL